MTTPATARVRLCLALTLALPGLACTDKFETCEESRELIEVDEIAVGGLSPEIAVARFDAAPTPTLTWHDPAILDDGWGLPHISLDHAGTCATPLDVEIELYEDDSVRVDPCASPALLIPIQVTLQSEDGIVAIQAEGGLVGLEDDELSFTVVLEAPPASFDVQLGPADVQHETKLVIQGRLVDGEIQGELLLFSDDCGTKCSYWAEYILGSFG